MRLQRNAITFCRYLFVSVFFVFGLLSSGLTTAQTETSLNSPLVEQHALKREKYLQLTALLTDGQADRARQRRAELDNYPLQYYFEYLLLRTQIKQSNDPQSFIKAVERYQSSWQDKRLQRRLYGTIKSRIVELKSWKDYPPLLKLANAPNHPCDDLYARVRNKLITGFDATAIKQWVKPVRHQGNCERAFTQLTGDGSVVLPVRALWQRSSGLIKRGLYDESRALYRYFSRRDKARLERWIAARDKPIGALQAFGRAADPLDREIMSDLLLIWARQDIVAAFDYWLANGERHGFPVSELQPRLRNFAIRAAQSDLADADRMLQRVEADRVVQFWRLRRALRAADWQQVLSLLNDLSVAEQNSSRWRYWRGRALQNLGDAAAAQAEFQAIADRVEYYGFLAADQIGQRYPLLSDNPLVNEVERQRLLAQPDMRRAIEFFLVGTSWEGRRIWNTMLKSASQDQQVAAADIATAIGWSDRALAAMKQAGHEAALDTLFPTPYRAEILGVSQRYSLQQELLYGLIRQESAFIADIRSAAGAVGLMQLMPSTARDMARKLGINVPGWKLIDHRTNIRLGARYVQQVLDRFGDNTVLAMAAYNAGPRRVSNWLGDTTLSADVWVESIPFDETRDYVKNVLFNTTIVEWRLQKGRTTRISQRMPDILPSG